LGSSFKNCLRDPAFVSIHPTWPAQEKNLGVNSQNADKWRVRSEYPAKNVVTNSVKSGSKKLVSLAFSRDENPA
jgi:hypothetical protein